MIQNHKVCQSLTESGDNLQISRAIEHKLYFADSSKKDSLEAKLVKNGFVIQKEIENEEGIKGLSFYRLDKPNYYDIDELTLFLIDMLEEHGASYDGWETSVVKS
jgi:regulator of RNase E activity RraB